MVSEGQTIRILGKTSSGDLKEVRTDTDGNLIASVLSSTATTIGDGRKVVAVAGTREALAASTACKHVIITAETDNTGTITVGGATTVAALATRSGIPLAAGASVSLDIDNLADIYIDSTVTGDGVTYTYTA